MTSHNMSRSIPVFLVLMAVAVILIVGGAATTGFVFGLIVVGIAGLLLGSMFLHEGLHSGHLEESRRRRLYRGPYTGRF
jgi:hypothetical protein